ncbi:anhydro-N-acetylmuramic acid kinase [Flavobacterium sp. RHBU_24]|uniref:anhydro-N-acetylmuramic acid kinase n=1 Tax=Flavobacterium sp. RHBU_24 TaxID=3391185 RepID=UPI0039854798
MIEKNYNVVGVMSGTSLDGVDIAHILLSEKNGQWNYETLTAETLPYTKEWVKTLQEAVSYNDEALTQLNIGYTALLGGIIKGFIARHTLTNLDAVCSHGHTILHQPQHGLTLQIGNLPQIAAYCGQTVVCDFRVQDVALGGQGAPLVPIGDRLLFAGYGYCLNLGGFSNISFEEGAKRVAFDICPVNTVLNYYANRLGYPYDDEGKIAAGGQINPLLLERLENLDFYKQPYPKSLGFEYVKEVVIPLIEEFNIQTEDKLRTFTRHAARQIAQAINNTDVKKPGLLITGGGAYNTYLIKSLKNLLPDMEIALPDDKTIQYKEALIFALLGVLKLRGDINVLGSVTGAPRDHSSGKIYTI